MTGIHVERVTAHIVEMRVGFAYSSGTRDRARAIIWEITAGHHLGLGECQFAGEKLTALQVDANDGYQAVDDAERAIRALGRHDPRARCPGPGHRTGAQQTRLLYHRAHRVHRLA